MCGEGMWDWVLLRGKERVCLCVRDDDDDDDDVLSICVCVCVRVCMKQLAPR